MSRNRALGYVACDLQIPDSASSGAFSCALFSVTTPLRSEAYLLPSSFLSHVLCVIVDEKRLTFLCGTSLMKHVRSADICFLFLRDTVCIMIRGGYRSLSHAIASVRNGIPLVVIAGTGGIADVIAHTSALLDGRTTHGSLGRADTEKVLRSSDTMKTLQTWIREFVSSPAGRDRSSNIIEDVVALMTHHRRFVVVFSYDQQSHPNLETAVFEALLPPQISEVLSVSAMQSHAGMKQQSISRHVLLRTMRMALKWNQLDVFAWCLEHYVPPVPVFRVSDDQAGEDLALNEMDETVLLYGGKRPLSVLLEWCFRHDRVDAAELITENVTGLLGDFLAKCARHVPEHGYVVSPSVNSPYVVQWKRNGQNFVPVRMQRYALAMKTGDITDLCEGDVALYTERGVAIRAGETAGAPSVLLGFGDCLGWVRALSTCTVEAVLVGEGHRVCASTAAGEKGTPLLRLTGVNEGFLRSLWQLELTQLDQLQSSGELLSIWNGTMHRVHVGEGSSVIEGQLLFTIITDVEGMEIPVYVHSPIDGVIREVLVVADCGVRHSCQLLSYEWMEGSDGTGRDHHVRMVRLTALKELRAVFYSTLIEDGIVHSTVDGIVSSVMAVESNTYHAGDVRCGDSLSFKVLELYFSDFYVQFVVLFVLCGRVGVGVCVERGGRAFSSSSVDFCRFSCCRFCFLLKRAGMRRVVCAACCAVCCAVKRLWQ